VLIQTDRFTILTRKRADSTIDVFVNHRLVGMIQESRIFGDRIFYLLNIRTPGHIVKNYKVPTYDDLKDAIEDAISTGLLLEEGELIDATSTGPEPGPAEPVDNPLLP
jgi:hypothetical protein